MPKTIKDRVPPDPAPEIEAMAEAFTLPSALELERQRFAAECTTLVYEGPDKGVHVGDRDLMHGDFYRCWPTEAEAKLGSPLFRLATDAELATGQADCCPNCAEGFDCAGKARIKEESTTP